jgi:hypothetical protein
LKTSLKIVIFLTLQLFCVLQNGFAQDTVSISKPVKHKFIGDPMRATMLAVVVPGSGQIYNRKYWKIPFVYAGFGALIYTARFNGSMYNEFMVAYQDFTDDVPETKSYLDLIPGAVDTSPEDPVSQFSPSDEAYWKDRLLIGVDYYKRYRDLSYIGIVGWYLVTIIDANVDASLLNYDISDNLDVAIFPSQIQLPGGYFGAGINVGLKITF